MKKALADWMRSFADIKPGEGRLTVLLFVYYLLVLFAYYILKPVSRALFLDNFDPDKLPWLYILMAILGGGGATWMSRVAGHQRLTQVIAKSQLFLLSNILLIWWLLQNRLSEIVLYIFSIWVGTFSVVVVGQFWLLANSLFDSRSARRLFPLIGLAAVFGGVFGGSTTALLAPVIGARNLVLVSGLLIGLTCLVVRALGEHETSSTPRAGPETAYRTGDQLRLVWQSSHLRSISLLVGVMLVVDTLVDYQFSVLAKQTYTGHQLVSFLARFQGIYLNVLSLFLQLFLAGPVLRNLGVGGALAFAPVSMAAGGIGLMAYPSLLVAASMKGVEAATRYTFTRTGLELLYLPISQDVKNRTKVFVEVFVDRVSRALAGGLLLLCTVVLAMSVRQVALLTLVFVGLWIATIIFAMRSYLSTLKNCISRREFHFESAANLPSDFATREVLLRSLDSENERQIAYTLHLLEQVPRISIAGRSSRLLTHPSPEVRLATFHLLAARKDPSARTDALKAVRESEGPVRVQAVHYLCQVDRNPLSKLQEFLMDPDLEVRVAAIGATEMYSYPRPLPVITDQWIKDLISRPSEESEVAKHLVAAALAFADPAIVPVEEHLRSLLADSSLAVVNGAIKTAGKLKDTKLIPLLIAALASRSSRMEAREALSSFGPSIVPTLLGHLDDQNESELLRLQIPRILADIDGPEAVSALVRHLPDHSIAFRFQILKALNRLRRAHPDLPTSDSVIHEVILQETKRYYQLLASLTCDTGPETDGRRLLSRSLEHRLDQTLERIFRLLGLLYPPEEIYDIFRAVRNPGSERRAAALEILDNILDQSEKQLFLPIVEDNSRERLVQLGMERCGLEQLSFDQCLINMVRGDDKWLKVASIYRAAEMRLHSLEADLAAAERDSDPFVAETASQAVCRMHQPV